MLRDDLDLQDIMDRSSSKLAELCDEVLDAASLEAAVGAGDPFPSRRRLCEYLDVGESTLAGWLKDDRVPRMAKEALVLPVAVGLLSEEIKRLRADAEDLKILKSGDVLQICLFEEDQEGSVIGRVVADNIQDLRTARMLSASMRRIRMLEEAVPVIDEMLERTENERYISHLTNLRRSIEEQTYFVTDYDEWKKKFGKRRPVPTLDEL